MKRLLLGNQTIMSSRVTLLDSPVAAPGVCALCGSANKPVVDFGKQLDWYGAVYFCQDCIREVSEVIGFVPIEPFQKLNEEYRKLIVENDRLVSQIQKLKETLSALLSGNECNCKSNTESSDSEPTPVEVASAVVEDNVDAVSRNSETEQPDRVEGSDDFFDTEDFE